jgi:sugar/nucleoside kinase (ribokinase family)
VTKSSSVMRFAAATAAIKCTRFGGGTGTPTRAEVVQFLLDQSEKRIS